MKNTPFAVIDNSFLCVSMDTFNNVIYDFRTTTAPFPLVDPGQSTILVANYGTNNTLKDA